MKAVINTLQGQSWSHLWYLYMLIGLYLVLPILKTVVNTLTHKQLGIIILILFVFAFVNPMLTKFADFNIGIRFPIMSEYVAYMLIGYRITTLQHYNITTLQLCVLTFAVVLFYAVLAWHEYIDGHGSLSVLAAYNSPLMAVYSALVFVLIKNTYADIKTIHKFWMTFTRDSFGIYVFHMLWVNVIYKVLKINPFDLGYWTLVPIFVCVAVLSWISTILFRKLPIIGKYI